MNFIGPENWGFYDNECGLDEIDCTETHISEVLKMSLGEKRVGISET